MLVIESLEWGYQNCVGIAIIGNNEILVAASRLDRVSSRVISISFTDVHCLHVKFVRLCEGEG